MLGIALERILNAGLAINASRNGATSKIILIKMMGIPTTKLQGVIKIAHRIAVAIATILPIVRLSSK